FVIKSSMIRFCSAAVPSDVILNSAETSGNSLSAFSTPRRAIVQKSEELLVTNASLSSRFPVLLLSRFSVLELQADIKSKRHKVMTVASCFIVCSPEARSVGGLSITDARYRACASRTGPTDDNCAIRIAPRLVKNLEKCTDDIP